MEIRDVEGRPGRGVLAASVGDRTGGHEARWDDGRSVASFGAFGSHVVNPPDLRPLMQPVLDSVELVLEAARQAGHLEPLGWDLFKANQASDRSSSFRGRIDEKALAKALAAVPETYDTLWASVGPFASVHLDVPTPSPYRMWVRSLTAQAMVWDDHAVDVAAEELLARLRDVVNIDGAWTGFVHIDSIADPYSEVVTGFSRLSRDEFKEEVVGYYWAVLLTAGHIDLLGGAQRVRSEAPCYKVEELTGASGTCLIAQLTESPRDLDLERIVAWRSYLAPVLRLGYPCPRSAKGADNELWLVEGEILPRSAQNLLNLRRDPKWPVPEVEWGTSSSAAGPRRCRIETTAAYEHDKHRKWLRAVVRAWFVCGLGGALGGVDGRLGACDDIVEEVEAQGSTYVAFGFDPGDCDVVGAVGKLVNALSIVEEMGGGARILRSVLIT